MVRVDLVVDLVAGLVEDDVTVLVGVARLADDEVRLGTARAAVGVAAEDLDAAVLVLVLDIVTHCCHLLEVVVSAGQDCRALTSLAPLVGEDGTASRRYLVKNELAE